MKEGICVDGEIPDPGDSAVEGYIVQAGRWNLESA
jgi:hypothetical protein